MSLDNEQIAETFIRWRFAETYPYMAEEIRWNAIGREEFIGREAVIAQCEKSARFLETVSGTLTKLILHRAGDFVIVEGAAQFVDREDQISRVASCDIFQFSEGRLVGITSYVIELNKP